jgi:hypothetical protein
MTLSCISSVRPHGTGRFQLRGFSWNLIFDIFSKFCRENSSFVKLWQEWQVLFMKSYVHSWYLVQPILEWETFQTKLYRKAKHTFHVQYIFFPENRAVYEIMWKKYCTSWQVTDDSAAHALCMLDTKGYKHTLRICNTASARPHWLQERSSALRYTFIACLLDLLLSR